MLRGCEVVGYCPYNNSKEGFPCSDCPYEKDGGYHEDDEESYVNLNRIELLNELMKRYSFEKAHSIRQIAMQDREFENDDICIVMTGTLDGDIFDCKWKN